MTPPIARTALVASAALLALSGCAAGPAPAPAGVGASSTRQGDATPSSTPGSASPTGPTASPVATSTTAALSPPAGPAWHSVAGSPALAVATVDGGRVSLLWMDVTRLRFRFVPGTQVPEGGPSAAADNRPSSWVPRMVAAFNGGFRLRDGVGGYAYDGRTVSPLRPGLGSFAVHRDGSLSVQVWRGGSTSPADDLVVRENLRPLVLDGVSQASPSDGARRWGLANKGLSTANRSALGQRPDGSLVFAYGYRVPAAAMGAALVSAGVGVGMMLDMNISWPTGFTYAHAGGQVVGSRINPHVVRSPSSYLHRFTKDFVAVEAR